MARSVSQGLHIPVFWLVTFGASCCGIMGATPFEVLHTLLLGLIKIVCKCIFEFEQSPNSRSGESTVKNPFKNDEFKRRVRILSQYSKRQSDCNRPQAVFNIGVTTLAGIQGQ
eukprot:6344554-Ditylum_brightwellii.AAC.1